MNNIPFKNQKVYVSANVLPGTGVGRSFFVRGRQAKGSQIYDVANLSALVALAIDQSLVLVPMERSKLAGAEAPLEFEQWLNLRQEWLSIVALDPKKVATLRWFIVRGGQYGGVEYDVFNASQDDYLPKKKKVAAKAAPSKKAPAKKPATTKVAAKKAAAPAKKRAAA